MANIYSRILKNDTVKNVIINTVKNKETGMKREIFFIVSLITTPLFGMQSSWDAEQYDRASDAQFTHGLKLLEQADLDADSEISILDIGCGTCRLAAHMAKNFHKGSVVAIDNDEGMIAKSKTKQATSPLSNLTIELKDARDLDYHEQFDVAVSVHCIHWFDNIEQLETFLSGVYKSLKPGGKFFAVFNIDHTESYPIPVLKGAREITEHPNWKKYYEGKRVLANSIPIEQYQESLTQAGFLGKAFIQNSGTIQLNPAMRMATIFAIPLGQAIPVEQREAFSRDVLAKLEEHGTKNPDGTYNQGLDCGIIIAQKPLN